MKRILLLIFIITPCMLFAKGYEGEYTIKGIMYGDNNTPLVNQTFIVNGKEVRTDSEGNYLLKIKWSTICPSSLSYFKRRKFIKEVNPKHLVFQYNNKNQKVKNKWKKFGLKYHWKKEDGVLVRHLYWKIP